MDDLKLTIELVPQSSWYSNLRKAVSRQDWDEIRKEAYRACAYRCGICGADGRLECHERWAYDDENHVQRLLGFVALCALCHHVKHIGLAHILAQQGQLDYEQVVAHFMRVNGCDRETFDAHEAHAFEVWAERSQHPWTVELGAYAALVNPTRAPARHVSPAL